MIVRIVLVASALVLGGSLAQADCDLVVGPCSTDGNGNTFTMQQNLGGGYSSFRNGSQYSTTGQTLGGGWQEQFNDGRTRTYNYDPHYGALQQNDLYLPQGN
jgi:hypothetical protein